MSTDAEKKLETVSQGIAFEFEKAVSWICDKAKIEDADRPYKLREWVGLLEQKFRLLTADGRTTDDDAALVAVALLNPEAFAKRLRGGTKGLCHRLFFYKRYAPYRFFSSLLFAVYHNSVRSVHYLKGLTLDIESINWHCYVEDWNRNIGVTTLILMLFWKGVYRVVDVPQFIVPNDRTATRTYSTTGKKSQLKVNAFRLCLESMLFCSLIELYTDVVYELIVSVLRMVHEWDEGLLRRNYFFGSQGLYLTVFGLLYFIDVVAILVVLALAAAEIFDFPARKRAKMEWRRSKILSSS